MAGRPLQEQLKDAGSEVARLEQDLKAAKRRRDELILKAVRKHIPQRAIGTAARVTGARVAQIASGK